MAMQHKFASKMQYSKNFYHYELKVSDLRDIQSLLREITKQLLNVDQIIFKIVKLIFFTKTITLIIIYSNINKDYSNHNA